MGQCHHPRGPTQQQPDIPPPVRCTATVPALMQAPHTARSSPTAEGSSPEGRNAAPVDASVPFTAETVL